MDAKMADNTHKNTVNATVAVEATK